MQKLEDLGLVENKQEASRLLDEILITNNKEEDDKKEFGSELKRRKSFR